MNVLQRLAAALQFWRHVTTSSAVHPGPGHPIFLRVRKTTERGSMALEGSAMGLWGTSCSGVHFAASDFENTRTKPKRDPMSKSLPDYSRCDILDVGPEGA